MTATKNSLRDYQIDARDICLSSDVGQIILPTGTGKSTIQAAIIESLMMSNVGFGVYVILTPRILLTNQLMSTVAKHLLSVGAGDIKALTVHSGNTANLYDEEDVTDTDRSIFDRLSNFATTSSKDVETEIRVAKFQNRPMLVCCTYDSIPSLVSGLISAGVGVTQVLCDEAHYVVEKTFNSHVSSLKNLSNRIHYFTATQKFTPNKINGLGMGNVGMYGEVIFKRTPLEMIEAGWMVQPRIHSVAAGKETAYHTITSQAFEKHSECVIGDAKMLVCCNGTKTVEEIRNNKDFKEWASTNGVTVFSVTSKYGSWVDGFEYTKRDDFLAALRSHTGKAVILHVAILTEGIDVPDMSGVLFFRDMAKCRFLQSLGRVTRKLKVDIGKAHDDCVKKFAYAIVIDREGDAEAGDQYTNLTSMTKGMRESGFESFENVYQSIDIGTDIGVEFDEAGSMDRRKKAFLAAIESVDHDIEDERIANILADDTVSFKNKMSMLFS
jgi:superfamily II DNA or RNA helicase